MGTVSTVTVGTDTFSVYNLDDGDTPAENLVSFWNGKLGATAAAVTVASTDDLNRAMIMASDWLDRAMVFSGSESVSGQPRSWPRDGASCSGNAIADGTTPDSVAQATFWMAGNIIVDPTIVDQASQGSNVKRVAAGSAEVEFFTPTLGGATDIRIPRTAFDYVACLQGGTATAAGSSSGDTGESAFDDCDFRRDRGFA